MSWPLVALSSFIEIKKGKKHKPCEHPTNLARRFLQIDDLRNDRNIKYTLDEKGDYATKNDVIIAWDGANAGTIGFGKEGLIGSTLAKLTFNTNKVNAEYLGLFLQSKHRELRENCTGATIPHISRAFLVSLKIPLPPLETQKQIAAVLEKADQLRKDCKLLEQELNSLAQSVFIDMFGDPVTNPKGWEMGELGNLCDKITDGTHKTPTYKNEGVKFLSAKNISSGEIDWINTKYISNEEHQALIKRCNPEFGDVLLAKSGTIGIAAMVNKNIEFSLFESAALIKYKREQLDSEYVLALLNSDSIKQLYRKNTKGNSIKHLHLIDIRSLEIPVPPMNIQRDFNKKIKAIHKLRANNRSSAGENESCFNALMQKAFKGELNL